MPYLITFATRNVKWNNRQNKMENLLKDIWPYLVTALFGAIAWLWKAVLSMKERLAVMENNMNTCKTNMDEDMDSLKEKVNAERDQIYKMIDKIQQRQDSHSKKQDDIHKMITDLDVKMVTKFGDMAKELSSIASDVKNINRVFQVYDEKIMLRKDNK